MQLHSPRFARHFSRCAILWLALAAAGAALADTSKISPDLLPLLANPAQKVNVIVQYNAPPTCGGGLLGGVLCTATNVLGVVNGVVNTLFTLLNAVAATVNAGDIVTISNQSNVSYISLDRPLRATLD